MTLRTSSARRPRGIVKVNGVPISFLKASVTSKSHFAADTFSVTLEAWQQPEGYGMAYWADATNVLVEILFGELADGADVSSAASDPTSIILGQVDDVEIDPFNQDSLIITGRDLSGQLIDTKTTNKWPDHVSSWIATTIAQQFNLTPDVTPTTTPVGQYYNESYASISRDIPTWDLLVFLAQQEGFDCYVSGTTLYFGPPQADTDANPVVITVQQTGGIIQSNASRLKLRRSLTLAKDITVTVLSHHVGSGTAVKAVATRSGSKTANSSASKSASTTLSYIIHRPGLTQEKAQILANQTLANLSRFEREFDATMQGDALLTTHKQAVIQGTQTSFDQPYWIQQITRTLDFSGAFAMTFNGKNIPIEPNPEV
jgi:phage protein D